MVKDILLLGNKELYKKSSEIKVEELSYIKNVVDDLRHTMINFRKRYGFGRAIAAPQIGVFKRLIYVDSCKPNVIINPILEFPFEKKIEVVDDCMSFPGLRVKVRRFEKCILKYKDLEFNSKEIIIEEDFSELIQHEYDHLDGILCVMRAITTKSFYFEKLA